MTFGRNVSAFRNTTLHLFKVHSSFQNCVNMNKGRWGPVTTPRDCPPIFMNPGFILWFITSALVLFLEYSKAGRGYKVPQTGNVILLRGQLSQGQWERHSGAGHCVHVRAWVWICWPMHQIKDEAFSNLLSGNRHGRQAARVLLSCFLMRLLCNCQKQERLSSQHALKPSSTICHKLAKNTKEPLQTLVL